MDVTPDTELDLSFEHQRAVVSPWGASLRRYVVQDRDGRDLDVLWGYSGGGNKKGGQGDVLIPFPGRIAGGRYSFDGETFQLDRNDKEGPNAIHGFVRTLPWSVISQRPDRVRFSIGLEADTYASKGYPFSISIIVMYVLNSRGLSCTFEVRNEGQRPAPLGVGFHPYFSVGTERIDHATAKIPASGYLEFNQQLAPTGTIVPVEGTEWDFRTLRSIGTRRFNHCYVSLQRDALGMATVSLQHPDTERAIDVVIDEAFRAIVVYTGDAIPGAARRAFAIEPMTCATDAFNHPDWGLISLAPGKMAEGCFLIRPRFRV